MTSSRGNQLLESYCLLFNELNSSSLHAYAQLCPTLCDPMNYSPPGSSVHGDSPGKKIGVGCCFLLQEIFPTQGSNPYVCLMSPALQAGSLPLAPPGKSLVKDSILKEQKENISMTTQIIVP